MKNIVTNALLLTTLIMASCGGNDKLAEEFASPPTTVTTGVYWYWMADNISAEGVVKDLHAMKAAGINAVFIGNIDGQGAPYGNVKLFTDEWWEILRTAMKTAAELDIEVGMFNCPGWSHIGGPWIKPEQSMRHLVASETRVTGGGNVSVKLPVPQQPTHFKTWSEDLVDNEGKPSPFFQDVRVLAIPVTNDYRENLFEAPGARVTTAHVKPVAGTEAYCLARVAETSPIAPRFVAPLGEEATVTLSLNEPREARSLRIYPASHCQGSGELLAKVDGAWRSVATFPLHRANPFPALGFTPFAPIVVAFDKVTADEFRVAFRVTWREAAIGRMALSPDAALDRYPEKTLARVTQAWTRNMIAPAGTPRAADAPVIDPAQVADLTAHMLPDGTLTWDAPAGEWLILRMGMVPSEVYTAPASAEGEGLEMDKLNPEFIPHHFDRFLGEVLRRIPAAERRSFRVAIVDSWEKGAQSFTDGFIDTFKTHFGYDPTPLLPIFAGHLTGTPDVAERFLWDVRRLSAEMLGNNLLPNLNRLAHPHGIKTWIENYGEEFAGEFLLYGKHADMVGGEFWMGGTEFWNNTRFIDVAASCAHIYGKPAVYAESFTSRDPGYTHHPRSLKRAADAAFAAGVTRSVLHVYLSQTEGVRQPGIQTWFGIEFNRNNTWFSQMDLFTTYLKRCGVMLEQGRNVADVAYFIGEEVPMGGGPFGLAPLKDGVSIPQLPAGYQADYVNSDVIIHSMSVENGRIVLPHGVSYRLLVLPPFATMRPEVLRKIEQLAAAGATILGDAPLRSPSLQNFPGADEEVAALAAEMWGDTTAKKRSYHKGRILSGMTIAEALATTGTPPDVVTGNDNVLFHHRSAAGREIYFIANQSDRTIEIAPVFRVAGKQPALWNPTDGSIRRLDAFTKNAETTSVPLQLAACESVFVVFDGAGTPRSADLADNFPQPVILTEIATPWTVVFASDSIRRGVAEPVVFPVLQSWTTRDDARIRHYSGTAVYTNTFTLDVKPAGRIYLSIDSVDVMAKIRVNQRYAGGMWTKPFRVDITDCVAAGENTLEIEVVNTWVNRLIGDAALPADIRPTSVFADPWKPDSELRKSGLSGKAYVMMNDK